MTALIGKKFQATEGKYDALRNCHSVAMQDTFTDDVYVKVD